MTLIIDGNGERSAIKSFHWQPKFKTLKQNLMNWKRRTHGATKHELRILRRKEANTVQRVALRVLRQKAREAEAEKGSASDKDIKAKNFQLFSNDSSCLCWVCVEFINPESTATACCVICCAHMMIMFIETKCDMMIILIFFSINFHHWNAVLYNALTTKVWFNWNKQELFVNLYCCLWLAVILYYFLSLLLFCFWYSLYRRCDHHCYRGFRFDE